MLQGCEDSVGDMPLAQQGAAFGAAAALGAAQCGNGTGSAGEGAMVAPAPLETMARPYELADTPADPASPLGAAFAGASGRGTPAAPSPRV